MNKYEGILLIKRLCVSGVCTATAAATQHRSSAVCFFSGHQSISIILHKYYIYYIILFIISILIKIL